MLSIRLLSKIAKKKKKFVLLVIIRNGNNREELSLPKFVVTGIVGSNPTQGMAVCMCIYSVLLLSCG
jgi:hypothetical protein